MLFYTMPFIQALVCAYFEICPKDFPPICPLLLSTEEFPAQGGVTARFYIGEYYDKHNGCRRHRISNMCDGGPPIKCTPGFSPKTEFTHELLHVMLNHRFPQFLVNDIYRFLHRNYLYYEFRIDTRDQLRQDVLNAEYVRYTQVGLLVAPVHLAEDSEEDSEEYPAENPAGPEYTSAHYDSSLSTFNPSIVKYDKWDGWDELDEWDDSWSKTNHRRKPDRRPNGKPNGQPDGQRIRQRSLLKRYLRSET
jgi:hypothetical protein